MDVGGQSPERKKWDPLLDEPFQAVIFFAGMDEYNMISTEEKDKTKMETAMEVFRTVRSVPGIGHMCAPTTTDAFLVDESSKTDRRDQNSLPQQIGSLQGQDRIG